MTREEAWNILCEFTKSESLRKHALAVEACLTAYARKFGEDETMWSVTALLHDFDWEIHPTLQEHPQKGEEILAERGIPEEIRRAILSHAPHLGIARQSNLEKSLFACDELAGFLTAISYVKPSRSIHEVDVKSVTKKMKDKGLRGQSVATTFGWERRRWVFRWRSTSNSVSGRCRRRQKNWD